MDFRLELRTAEGRMDARMYDVHNPAKPIALGDEEA